MIACPFKNCLSVLTPSLLSWGITLIALLSLGTAFVAEHHFAILPCTLCIYERWVFAILALTGLCYAFLPFKPLFSCLQSLTLWGGAGLTFYHLGVEHHWWPAPSACHSTPLADNIEQLRAFILEKQPVPCDKPGWVILGFSAVFWTFLLFIGLIIAKKAARSCQS
jgi:disulfide bond formation protein DsbB